MWRSVERERMSAIASSQVPMERGASGGGPSISSATVTSGTAAARAGPAAPVADAPVDDGAG